MRELFYQIERLSEDRKFEIGISYLEIYNELVMNLLTKSGPLKLREDSNGVVVGGLILKQIHNAEELFNLLTLGNKNRTQHPTDANEESSRSHAIFQVHIRMTDKRTSVRRTVKLSMIDLAGSERAQSTKCKGLRFKEGANINKSLLALGNCINKLADGSKHIPYRDSNLTRILKDSLGGNCQTLMIANISPSSLTYEDTYNTLKYASRAKKIRHTLKQNVVGSNMPKEFLIKKCNEQVSQITALKSENEKHLERIKLLESQLLDQKILSKQFNGALGDGPELENDLIHWYEKIDSAFSNYNRVHEKCLSLQSNEKILSFRIRNKEKYEEIRKMLPLDGSSVQQVSDFIQYTRTIIATVPKFIPSEPKAHFV
jgi:kinesin family member 18/19